MLLELSREENQTRGLPRRTRDTKSMGLLVPYLDAFSSKMSNVYALHGSLMIKTYVENLLNSHAAAKDKTVAILNRLTS